MDTYKFKSNEIEDCLEKYEKFVKTYFIFKSQLRDKIGNNLNIKSYLNDIIS